MFFRGLISLKGRGKNRKGQKSSCDTALTNLKGNFGTRIADQSFLAWLKWLVCGPWPCSVIGVSHPSMCVITGKTDHCWWADQEVAGKERWSANHSPYSWAPSPSLKGDLGMHLWSTHALMWYGKQSLFSFVAEKDEDLEDLVVMTAVQSRTQLWLMWLLIHWEGRIPQQLPL